MTKQERTEMQLQHQIATMAEQINRLQTTNDRLHVELPLMRKENQRLTGFIQDAHAYVRHSFHEGTRESTILMNLAHDLRGLANDEPCFSPRVTGYAEREKVNSSKLL